MIRPRKALGIAGEKRHVFVAELRTLSAIADEIHAVQYRIITTAFLAVLCRAERTIAERVMPSRRMQVPWISTVAALERLLDQEQAADYDDTRAKLKVEGSPGRPSWRRST